MTVNVRQAGRPPLIATSRTPKARARPAGRWFRDHVRAHLVSGTPASADGRRPRATWAGLGLVVLVVLTTCAVAWVSVWWVPAYLALMVLIFVTPQGRCQPARASEPGEESAGVVLTDLGNSAANRSCGRGWITTTSSPSWSQVQQPASRPPNQRVSALDSASSGTAKPRRGRGRARKAAKTAAEPAPDSAPVTWIRVGPGKFVRADANSQAIDQAQTEDVDRGRISGNGRARRRYRQRQRYPPPRWWSKTLSDPPETTPGDEGMVVASDDCVLGSVTEEYGIAPSAFGPVPPAHILG